MKEVAKLLEDLKASGVILDYALFGAVAQMRYTEPVGYPGCWCSGFTKR